MSGLDRRPFFLDDRAFAIDNPPCLIVLQSQYDQDRAVFPSPSASSRDQASRIPLTESAQRRCELDQVAEAVLPGIEDDELVVLHARVPRLAEDAVVPVRGRRVPV